MVRAGIDDVDAKLEQPDPQLGPPDRRAGAPRNAVVDQKGIRKTIAAERVFEVLLDRLGLLIAAGLKT